jgi:hemerythrin
VDILIWKPSHSVKVARCDDDHKRLISIINSLQCAMSNGKGAVEVGRIVEELGKYAKEHFFAEESMMEKTNYSELASHRGEHQAFVRRVDQLKEDIAAGKFVSSVPVAKFLADWFAEHVTQTDQRYAHHLNANGIS